MLFGPKETTFVNSIASETGANVFNITPRNNMGKVPLKPNVTKMIHMVSKLSRTFSHFYIDTRRADLCQKIPKEESTDPAE
jgi:hypothetical protein